MQKRTASAPAFKGISGFDQMEIPIFRDSQDVTAANLSGSTLEWFPQNPSKTNAEANYRSKPFVGDRRYYLAALSIEPSFQKLQQDPTDTSVDLVTLYNQLSHARVLFQTDLGQEQLLNEHISQFMELDMHAYHATAYNDTLNNAGFVEQIDFGSTGPLLLPDPIVIGSSEQFNLKIEYDRTSAFPTEANWTSLGQGGTLQLVAKVQVAYRE